MPAALAESPVGRRLAHYVARLRDGGVDVTDEELAATWVVTPPNPPPPVRRLVCAHFQAAVGAFRIQRYEPHRDDFALACAEDARGRSWRIWVQLEAEPPHRIHLAMASRTAPPGTVIRPARPDDAAALRALERDCPLVMGDVRVTYDRGDDWFAGARLVGESSPTVAEQDGRLVAVHCVLTHPLRVGGHVLRAAYLHHTRIRSDAQRGGLFSALNGAEMERHARSTDTVYSYVAVGNEASMKQVPVPPWSIRLERILIDCRAQAGPPAGRPAVPADAGRVVALVNAAHERAEFFVPYTTERLAARLGRDPRTYGWAHLRLGDAAVVGVWPAGMRIVREDRDGREETIRALVLDYGFAPGAEGELIALLRAWCAELADRGMSHASVFTSPGGAGRAALHGLAARVEPFTVNIGLPEPPDVETRGVYVDHLYF
jgi:hypothetical protein